MGYISLLDDTSYDLLFHPQVTTKNWPSNAHLIILKINNPWMLNIYRWEKTVNKRIYFIFFKVWNLEMSEQSRFCWFTDLLVDQVSMCLSWGIQKRGGGVSEIPHVNMLQKDLEFKHFLKLWILYSW